jgi:pyruvate dehydrogenase (quinone)
VSFTVSDHLLERLAANGVHRLYGYPGDGISGIMGAMNRAGGGIDGSGPLEFVQVRHEEMAAFMACAHAKFTGEVGVCLSTSGPGAIHLLNGLYDAKLDHQPVVAIVGQQAQTALGGNYASSSQCVTAIPPSGCSRRTRARPSASRKRSPKACRGSSARWHEAS